VLPLNERQLATPREPRDPAQGRPPGRAGRHAWRTLASNTLEASGGGVAASGLLGHSSPAVIAQYGRCGERVKERLTARLHVPYYAREVNGL